LDYDDFATHTSGGGSGGLKTAKTAGANSSTTTFSASYIVGFCQGIITNTGDFWWDKSIADGIPAISTSNLGADGQPGDPYWESAHPDKFLNYSGTVNLTLDNGNLGKASTLPNLSVEIIGILANSGVNSSDADPSQIIVDFLTIPRYGAGFPPENLASLDALRAYCRAAGIFCRRCSIPSSRRSIHWGCSRVVQQRNCVVRINLKSSPRRSIVVGTHISE
jgi:hypothetical protein